MTEVRKLSLKVLQDTSEFVGTFSGLEDGQVHGDIRGKRDNAIASWMTLRDVVGLLVEKMHSEPEG